MTRLRQVLLLLLAGSFSTAASADVIDFIDMTDGGVYGESAWNPLTLSFAGFTVTITGTGPNGAAYAYLDYRRAGLGVCKKLLNSNSANKQNTNSRANLCSPSSDDNVTTGEALHFVFDVDVVIDNFWFNNNHDGGFGAGDMVNIGGNNFAVRTGYAEGANGIGSFAVTAGQMLTVRFANEQFYISGMEIHAVPEPGTLLLLGAGLLAVGARRKLRAKT